MENEFFFSLFCSPFDRSRAQRSVADALFELTPIRLFANDFSGGRAVISKIKRHLRGLAGDETRRDFFGRFWCENWQRSRPLNPGLCSCKSYSVNIRFACVRSTFPFPLQFQSRRLSKKHSLRGVTCISPLLFAVFMLEGRHACVVFAFMSCAQTRWNGELRVFSVRESIGCSRFGV